jgi:hypothetical protein
MGYGVDQGKDGGGHDERITLRRPLA